MKITATFSVHIDAPVPPLSVVQPTLDAAEVGQPVSQQLKADGGKPPLKFELAEGSSLPEGLSLSPDGALSGTPVTAGDFTFDAVISDSRG